MGVDIHCRLCVRLGICNLGKVGVFRLSSLQKRREMLAERTRVGFFLI